MPFARLRISLFAKSASLIPKPFVKRTFKTAAVLKMQPEQHFSKTSGETDAVWIHQLPFDKYPEFSQLKKDVNTDVCIIGAGISGISIAHELVTRGHQVTLIEARKVLSGETGRTSGHLSNALDDGYTEIAKKHGQNGAKAAAESHTWALEHVGEVSSKLGIECEYRKLPGYEISQYPRGDKNHDSEVDGLKEEVDQARKLGLEVEYKPGFAVRGWDGPIDQRDAAVFADQATFHPTKYLVGLLEWLKQQPNFQCYTDTCMLSTEEKGVEILGVGSKTVNITIANGSTIHANHCVQATCVPLQKLAVIVEMTWMRTYCIAIRVPKDYIEDCLLYDEAEAYKYIRFTACDAENDYLVIGGCDHKVGQEDTRGRFEELERWVRERFTKAGAVDYKWSGQVFEPVDFMAFIGRNQGDKHTFVVTGDSGNGLTHGVLAGRLIADEIEGIDNPWAALYAPTRLASIAKSLPTMLSNDLQANAQYKRFLQSDITDIEDLAKGEGGVLNPTAKAPIAVYRDDKGEVHKYSALCPHLKGVVCWNTTEKSWDCPVHGSRFSMDGQCVMGPAKAGLSEA